MPSRVLVVDDEPNIVRTLGRALELEGYEVEGSGSLAEARAAFAARRPDLVVLDVRLPDGSGLDWLEELTGGGRPVVPVVVISGNASVDDAVRALQLGAETYLEKPPEAERLLRTVEHALSRQRLEAEVEELRADRGPTEILGRSLAMRRLLDLVDRVAASEAWVLVTGENGTGKELVARAVHDRSARKDRPFISLNCAAVPAELIESELFGHEKGAFTGAHGRKLGKFERAHRGTLFLDEVGDMPSAMQAKLLRVLQNGELERVGGEARIRVDVRVVAATNKNLQTEIERGAFREDLYYRLAVVVLTTPALRERREDIALLSDRFVAEAAQRNRRRAPPVLSDGAKARLAAHDFPGNVRELRNLVERLVILGPPDRIEAADVEAVLPGRPAALGPGWRPGKKLFDLVHEAERAIVAEALAAHGDSVAEAARALGVERSNFHKKLKALGLK